MLYCETLNNKLSPCITPSIMIYVAEVVHFNFVNFEIVYKRVEQEALARKYLRPEARFEDRGSARRRISISITEQSSLLHLKENLNNLSLLLHSRHRRRHLHPKYKDQFSGKQTPINLGRHSKGR